jgi:hypothetical protein
MNYPGYRITLNAAFAKMKDKIHIDIGIGDTVHPEPYEIQLTQYKGKPFFEEFISLLVYPPETIFAEKLETLLSKGTRNSRMKDYHDLYLLCYSDLINLPKLKKSISNTFGNREAILTFIQFDLTELKLLQKLWIAHLSGLGSISKNLKLPEDIKLVIEKINQTIRSLPN